ncbi:MAG: hypothetical protein AB1502_08980 [Thermodesulfobacteriota bacterium]
MSTLRLLTINAGACLRPETSAIRSTWRLSTGSVEPLRPRAQPACPAYRRQGLTLHFDRLSVLSPSINAGP